MSEMKKRWIALYVENDVGVLAKVSGLFSGKSYNLQSLTVGTTEDETVSRMTISVASDDITFEQIKKQLNRMVEVIKVIDLTNVPLRLKELMFVKIMELNETQMTEVFQIDRPCVWMWWISESAVLCLSAEEQSRNMTI